MARLQLTDRYAKKLPTMALKAILLDAAGTLFTSVRPIGESYAQLARRHGKAVSATELAERFSQCHSTASPLAFPGAQGEELRELERNWWKELVRRIFEPFSPFENFDPYFAELFDYFSKPEAWFLFAGTVETLKTLKERGLILCVISNFDSRLFGILKGLGISSHFDSVLISSQVGYAKPAAGIFKEALNRYGLSPEEALHVGDSPETDIAGAMGAGLQGILLDPSTSNSADGQRIKNLKGILSVIDGKVP